jgi:hypothetical protein
MNEALTKFWNSQFEGFAPEAHNLKHEFKDRWVRFHSLPESKRYPESESEYQEVLSRNNSLLQEIFGLQSSVLVLLSEYSDSVEPIKPEIELHELFPESTYWCSIAQHEEEDDDKFYWHLHSAKVTPNSIELNDLFRLVANDEVRDIIIVGIASKTVFHPYDGGADVILSSTEQRNELKNKFSMWLSAHPDGY